MCREPLAGRGSRRRGLLSAETLAAALCAGVIALLAVAGCGGATAGQTSPALKRVAGGLTARLTISAAPAPVMKPVRLSVALADADGRPVTDRPVAFDLSMPSMSMAPNRPRVRQSSAGVYAATATLPMAGEWRLTVEIGSGGDRIAIPFRLSAE